MSSGRDVWMESWGKKSYDSPKSGDSVDEIKYYARVNDGGMTHGTLKQLDDNLEIVYNFKEHRIVAVNVI